MKVETEARKKIHSFFLTATLGQARPRCFGTYPSSSSSRAGFMPTVPPCPLPWCGAAQPNPNPLHSQPFPLTQSRRPGLLPGLCVLYKAPQFCYIVSKLHSDCVGQMVWLFPVYSGGN